MKLRDFVRALLEASYPSSCEVSDETADMSTFELIREWYELIVAQATLDNFTPANLENLLEATLERAIQQVGGRHRRITSDVYRRAFGTQVYMRVKLGLQAALTVIEQAREPISV